MQADDAGVGGVGEFLRLAALHSYEVLDTDFEAAYDHVVVAAAQRFRAPISLISLVDERRQWFKACYGLTFRETERKLAFCAHVVASRQTLIVGDARIDPRFANNELVIGSPGIRFYAGVPLMTRLGRCLGSLNVIDTVPRSDWSDSDTDELQALGDEVMSLLERRRIDLIRRRALAELPTKRP